MKVRLLNEIPGLEIWVGQCDLFNPIMYLSTQEFKCVPVNCWEKA